jgi:Rrf2 family nitric oxide-sensitive transcriptional repressor
MHITRYTDYSLRVLMYLAVKGDELSTIQDIADSYAISKNHLMKIVQALSAKNYLLAIRGKNGGIKLNTDPKDINIGTLVRDLEQDQSIVECFGQANACVITPSCQLKSIFHEALESFFKSLDNYSLADLIPTNNQDKLREILNIKTIQLN